ncbi:MAG TPA: hypothetical protein PKA77_17625 [Chitinophagaceae bacterium]|nr:hypothetical protein [Chitinophagaceae bacterium]
MRQKVLDCLGDRIFECTTVQDFAYESLMCFYPINKSLKNELQSIEKACSKIFRLFPVGRGRVYTLNRVGSTTEIIRKKDEITPIQQFLQTYLEFETSPGITLKYLEEAVKQDMFELHELIKGYENEEFIKEHISKNRLPKNHEERILYDYYYRCTREQKVITEYFLTGIKKRAITKANYWFGTALKQIFTWSEAYRDRPYHYATYLSAAYFNCNKIDLIANKVSNFPIEESGRLEKLYENNKASFYRVLLKREKPAQILQELRYYIPHLPMKNDRLPIFEELEKLFKGKYWIGFYSLALTQIEGVFSEMYNILNPNGEQNKKALPDKVEYARAFHDMSHYYFDYYQYHIPRLRNKFMHYGHDTEFKLKSFDLLFDLRYLLKMFTELKNPFVKIRQIHIKRRFEDFITCGDYANYFVLLNSLTAKQKEEIRTDIYNFEKEFLIEHCNAEYVCLEVAQDIPVIMNTFLAEANTRLKNHNKVFDFSERNFTRLEELITNDAELAEILSDCFMFNRNESDSLQSFYWFLFNYKKHLPSLNKEYVKVLTETAVTHNTQLSNIHRIKALLPTSE